MNQLLELLLLLMVESHAFLLYQWSSDVMCHPVLGPLVLTYHQVVRALRLV